MERNIIAFGGGSIVDPDLLDYCCDLVQKKSKEEPLKICYIPTASGDAKDRVGVFYKLGVEDTRFNKAKLSHLSLNEYYSEFDQDKFNPVTLDNETISPEKARNMLSNRTEIVQNYLRDLLLNQDVIYVGGGNTANMLEIWKIQGIIPILKECYEKGVILCGSSAGGLCWCTGGITLSFGIVNGTNEGMGIINYRIAPHFQEYYRKSTARLVLLSESDQNTKGDPMIGIDEGAAVHFRNEKLMGYVSYENTAAYFLDVDECGNLTTLTMPSCI